MNGTQLRSNDLDLEIGSSNWLTTLPINDGGYVLNKQQFWDALRIRYNWQIPVLVVQNSHYSILCHVRKMDSLSCVITTYAISYQPF